VLVDGQSSSIGSKRTTWFAPELWEMSIEEVRSAVGTLQMERAEVPPGAGPEVGPEGKQIVDVNEKGRSR
jgi:hypothetical protein